MSHYVENHLRIWGKDAVAFMKAAAGEEGGETKRPVAFDPNSIRPTPQELMGIDPSADLPEAKKKALIEKYGHANWVEWREANWEAVYTFAGAPIWNSDTNWSLLRKQSGSTAETPFAKDISGRRLARYPGKVWCASYWSRTSPPYKLLEYIGQTWDIQLENFYDTDELLYCGVYGSQGRTGKRIWHLVFGADHDFAISYDKEGVDTFDMEFGDLPPETWKQIDEIKKAVYGLSGFKMKLHSESRSMSDDGKTWIDDPPDWIQFEDRRKRSLQKAKKIIEAAIQAGSGKSKGKLNKAETEEQVAKIKEVLAIGDPNGAWELVQKLDNPRIFEELLKNCVGGRILTNSTVEKVTPHEIDGFYFPCPHGEFFIKLLIHLPKEAQIKPELKEITELDLSDMGITDVSLLAQLQQLTVLDLSSNQIDDISPLESLKQLKYLNLSYNDDLTKTQLDELCEYKNKGGVRRRATNAYVNHDVELTSDEAKQVIDAAIREEIKKPKGKLTKADLGKVTTLAFKADETIAVRALPELPQLRRIEINRSRTGHYNPHHLSSDLQELTQIKELDLGHCGIRKLDRLVNHLCELKELRKLNLRANCPIMSGGQIDDASVSALANLKQITELDISHNDLTDVSFLKELKQLNSLNLESNNISDSSFLKELTQLEELNLGFILISDASSLFETLRELKQLRKLNLTGHAKSHIDVSPVAELQQLEELNLSCNQVTDLSFLRKLTRLTHLKLASNKITDLSPLVELKQLKALAFDDPDYGADGNHISNVSPLKELKQLENLNLSGCKIGDLSVLVDTLKGLKRLRKLYLAYNQINDVSALKELTQLTKLWLDGNPDLTKAQIDELQKALPNCKINHNAKK